MTGAGEGVFLSSALLFGLRLQSLESGQGVVIAPDGSASGDFQSLLLGVSVLGIAQTIGVVGQASQGSVSADGGGSVSGTASVELGNGTPPLLGMPFRVTATSQGLQLRLGTTTLPLARLTAGSLTIQ